MNQEDLQRAYLLLEIVEKCAGHTGKFGSISSAAMTELIALNDTLRAEQMEAAKDREAAAEAARPKAIPSTPEDDTDAVSTMTPSQRRL